MKEYPITSRTKALREKYMNSEMMRCKLSYGRARRMQLLYIQGWNAYAEIKNPILRRAYADAYLLDNMVPVIVDGELIVGQPDFSPLTPEEEEAVKQPCNMPAAPGRHDHMALDFEKLLRLGVLGLIAELESKNVPDNVFYTGAIEELRALIRLAERYARAARAKGMADVADILHCRASISTVLHYGDCIRRGVRTDISTAIIAEILMPVFLRKQMHRNLLTVFV